MAAITYTATAVSRPPRVHPTALTNVVVSYTLGGAGSLSASDVILICKIPDQVTVVDGYISGTCGGDATIWKVGIGTTHAATGTTNEAVFGAVATLSETAQMKTFTGLPYRVSLSATEDQAWTYVMLTRVSGTSTATASIQLSISYGRPGTVA